MCFSSKAMEQQALKMTELIQKKSVYKFMKTNFISDESSSSYNDQDNKNTVLITKIILEDSDGTKYNIEPNFNGLKFAKGEVTYQEYKKLEKNEKIKGLWLVSVSTSVYLLLGGTIIWYLY